MGRPSYLRAIFALAGAVFLTLFIGLNLGTPLNPTAVRIIQAKIDLAVAEQRTYSDVDRDARFSSPRPPDPPFWAAILDWHAWLLVPTLILTTLLLRPGLAPTILASGISSAAIAYLVAPAVAVFLLVGAAGGILATCVLAAIKSKRSTVAA